MTGDPKRFRVINSEPPENLLRAARRLLAEVESGQIHSFAVVAQGNGGEITHGFSKSKDSDVFALIGGVTVLQQQLMKDLVEWPEVSP